MRKKIDERIRILIENAVKLNFRSFFIIVGDRGRDQVVNLHYLLSNFRSQVRPNILWCYKKKLDMSAHKKKRLKQISKLKQKGLYDVNMENPFELFISTTDIKYWYYKDAHRVLGQTFGMLVIQDFETITPNLLCRSFETIEGGGIIVLLLNTMNSLRQLYTITMDVHDRYRSGEMIAGGNTKNIVPRFNERFLLSLAKCKSALVLDDELNILPISTHNANIKPMLPEKEEDLFQRKEERELHEYQESLKDKLPISSLVNICKTIDQAKAVAMLVETIAKKALTTTSVLTAGRGRGKSASLGLAIASSLAYGFSNIFITAPSPENIGTVFEFIIKGMECLNYIEHRDYEILESTLTLDKGDKEIGGRGSSQKCITRINIFKEHRQSIEYIKPGEYMRLGQAELLVIDEAAAIPLPIVRRLMGEHIVFLSSTINGYEGTGRALSLKLVEELKSKNSRNVEELTMNTPIRYGRGDPIEGWLHNLLCLDSTLALELQQTIPHPNSTDLYRVNRETLFSCHTSSERFLRSIFSLFVSSHYKNSPNDLQLLSDAPAHNIFVLLGPLENNNNNPDILCAIQVCREGGMNKQYVQNNMQRGFMPSGDLIPWVVTQQFLDYNFAQLVGIRIVRIATHPQLQGMGYGSMALKLLFKYYMGELLNPDDIKLQGELESGNAVPQDLSSDLLHKENIKPKKKLKPLLQHLSQRKPYPIQYIGTSFGLTPQLYNFWAKNGFQILYLRQTSNELTGEHSCIMLKTCSNISPTGGSLQVSAFSQGIDTAEEKDWISAYTTDFQRRLTSLLGYEFRSLPTSLALSLVAPKILSTNESEEEQEDKKSKNNIITQHISIFDLRRLESYTKNLVDYHMILDLVPTIARLLFLDMMHGVQLTFIQGALLLGMGLQYKTVETIAGELNIGVSQVLAMFNKSIRKVNRVVREFYQGQLGGIAPQKRLYMEGDMSKPEEEPSKSKGKKAKIKTNEKYNILKKDMDQTEKLS